MQNPWLNLWVDAFETWSSGVREFWLSEMHRQQSALMREATHQQMESWTRAWTVLPMELMGKMGGGCRA